MDYFTYPLPAPNTQSGPLLTPEDANALVAYQARKSIDTAHKEQELMMEYQQKIALEDARSRIKLAQAEAMEQIREKYETKRCELVISKDGELLYEVLVDGKVTRRCPVVDVKGLSHRTIVANRRNEKLALISWAGCLHPIVAKGMLTATRLGKILCGAGISLKANKNNRHAVLEDLLAFLLCKSEIYQCSPCYGWDYRPESGWHFTLEGEKTFDDYLADAEASDE